MAFTWFSEEITVCVLGKGLHDKVMTFSWSFDWIMSLLVCVFLCVCLCAQGEECRPVRTCLRCPYKQCAAEQLCLTAPTTHTHADTSKHCTKAHILLAPLLTISDIRTTQTLKHAHNSSTPRQAPSNQTSGNGSQSLPPSLSPPAREPCGETPPASVHLSLERARAASSVRADERAFIRLRGFKHVLNSLF